MPNVRRGDLKLVAFDWAPPGWRTDERLANTFLVGASANELTPGMGGRIHVVSRQDPKKDRGRFLVLHYIEAVEDRNEQAFLGEIQLFAGNLVPRNWAVCGGQLLRIMSHTALFSIFGTSFGGDGTSTFALPDLRNRIPIGKRSTDSNLGAITGGYVEPEADVNSDAVRVTRGRLASMSMNYLIRVESAFFPALP